MSQSSSRQLDYAALLPSVGVYGGVRRFVEIGNELVRRGHRFTIYHPGGDAPDWLPFSGDARPLATLDGSRHDVLICNDPPLVPAFERARARLKLFYFALEGISGERRIARHSGWVAVANSTGMVDRLRRLHGVRAEKAIGGVDLDTFQPPPRPRAPDGTVRVLAFGRLSRSRKGAPIAIRAAESLQRRLARRGDLRVTMVMFDHIGHGNERDPREDVSTRLPLEFHLNLGQSELAALYGGCDVFVSAEKRAGWANTVAEAMACATPVVCTRSGTRDLAAHLETAWVTRWRHPITIGRGLRELQRRPELARRLSDAARERVGAFAWPHVADRIEDIVSRHLA